MTQTALAVVPDEIAAIPETLFDVSAFARLAEAGALTTTALNLRALHRELSADEFENLGRAIGDVKRTFSSMTSWWVGDWILFSEDVDIYEQVADATGLSKGALANSRWVCSRFPEKRRRSELAFGHHATVAAMQPRTQNAWLKRAVDGRWTREQLRDAIKEADEMPVVEQPQWSQNGDGNLAAEIVVAARALIRESSDAGGGQVLVPKERVDRLAALLGEDE